MTKKSALILASLAAIAVFVLYVSQNDQVEIATGTEVMSGVTEPNTVSLPANRDSVSVNEVTPAGPHPLSKFKNSIDDYAGGMDPMIVLAEGDFSDAEIAAYNDLHVIPFNRRVRQECMEIPTYDSPVRRDLCTNVRENPPHPYTQLDLDELKHLATTDAAAANVVAMRVKNTEEREYWYLRAAALSEKSGPLLELANRRYMSAHQIVRTADGKRERVPLESHLIKRAALELIASKMGDPRANPEYWEQKVELLLGKEKLQNVMTVTDGFVASMAEVQRTVTGSTQILEDFDA